MNPYYKIKQYVTKAEQESRPLELTETVKLLTCVKEISNEKELIHKIICLVTLISDEEEQVGSLTQRESQIFNLIGCGFTSEDIAGMLTISKSTVGTHRKNIIKKLNLNGSGRLKSVAYKRTQEIIAKSKN
ncbi:response regulator transcription factor [Jejudonia soesokkakensis]|uniref:Response regulator transcription factor n=1 Tax=Jejudonia soesokkakensis TaxID=1323432 RepID=A0ABW2MXX6_9FLAO